MHITDKIGYRLLTEVVDERASRYPDQLHSLIYVSSDLSSGPIKITYSKLANAVNRLAAWLVDDHGLETATIAFIGCSDIRSVVFLLASMKAGYTALLLSSYTSTQAIRQLVKDYKCRAVLFTDFTESSVSGLDKATRLPSFDYLFPTNEIAPIIPAGNYEDERSWVVAIIFTSGSTGAPKAVRITNERLSVMDVTQTLPPHHGRPVLQYVGTLDAKLKYIALDLSYMGGIEIGIVCPIWEGRPIVLNPPDVVSMDMQSTHFVTVMEDCRPDSLLTYPNVIERLMRDPKASELLFRMRDIGFIGGPLNSAVRKQVVARTHLSVYIGSSEVGSLIIHEGTKSPHDYICINSEKLGIEWVNITENLFEPVFHRQAHLAKHQMVFYSFPDVDVWPMGDLFSKHASEPDTWKYEGRKDETLVLSNGANFPPAETERVLEAHPAVRNAVLVGNGRPGLAVILQLAESCRTEPWQDMVNLIWPTIERLNAVAGPLAQIDRSHVLLSSPEKPFVLSKKGAVLRRSTIALYEKELDAVFET